MRFGDVHLYDNLYTQTTEGLFQYYWGAGIESSIYAENNAFELAPGVDPARIITRWAGTQLFETGSTVNGQPTDILAAFNATAPVPLAATARWNPADVYDYTLDPVEDVPAIVRAEAGAGVLASGTPVATAAPGVAVLSDDNGQGTGLFDGSYTVTANLYWGQNATVAKLYENGVLVDAQWLTGTTPRRQTVAFPVTGKVNGTYTYVVELLNPYGTSTSRPRTVVVKDASPGARGPVRRQPRRRRLVHRDDQPVVGHQRDALRALPRRGAGRRAGPHRRDARGARPSGPR